MVKGMLGQIKEWAITVKGPEMMMIKGNFVSISTQSQALISQSIETSELIISNFLFTKV